jgi:hypothetical protein
MMRAARINRKTDTNSFVTAGGRSRDAEGYICIVKKCVARPAAVAPVRTCFLGSQMNAIGEFSARLNGFRLPSYPAEMSSRQKQETPGRGSNGIRSVTYVENISAGPKPAPDRLRGPRVVPGDLFLPDVSKTEHSQFSSGPILWVMPSTSDAAFYAGVTSAGTWRKDEFDGRVSSGRRGFG